MEHDQDYDPAPNWVGEPTVADLITELTKNNYMFLKYVPGRGICGLARMYFTTGLFYGLEWDTYQGRYCYESKLEALQDLFAWDGAGDPPGDWIKHKGHVEYSNPNYIKE